MNAINILGAVGEGVVKGQQINQERDMRKQEMAIKDFQLKKLADEEAADNRFLPLDKIFPEHQNMPETFKFLKDTAEQTGWGGDIKQVGEAYFVKQKAAKNLMAMTAMSNDLRTKMMEATQLDLSNKYSNNAAILKTGMDSQGNKLKPEQLEMLAKEQERVTTALSKLVEVKSMMSEKVMAAQVKAQADLQKRDLVGRDANGLVYADQTGKLFYQNGTEFTGDPRSVKTKSELTKTSVNIGSITSDSTQHQESELERIFKRLSPDRRKELGIKDEIDLKIYLEREKAKETAPFKNKKEGGILPPTVRQKIK